MADFVRGFYCLVVILAVGFYSVMLMRGVNKQLSSHFISNIRTEMEDNPYMKNDYEKFKKEESEREVKEKQVQELKELEQEAKRIQEKLAKLSSKSGKYVKIEDSGEDYHDQSNQSRGHVEL